MNDVKKKNSMMLATFAVDSTIDSTIKNIYSSFLLDSEKIFIFYEYNDITKKILTYNVLFENDEKVQISKVRKTIRINRKKESNTLYTINALNKLIQESNNGVLDIHYKMDWQNYRNSIILFDKTDESVMITKTKLYHIITKTEFNKNKTALINKNPQYI